jgi:hypothetical protein
VGGRADRQAGEKVAGGRTAPGTTTNLMSLIFVILSPAGSMSQSRIAIVENRQPFLSSPRPANFFKTYSK